MTTRLPIRIEPLPGEWWRGYVTRVASCYGVQPRALLSSVPGATVLTRQGLTWSGTVATPEAIRELAHAFRLDPREVDRMHLSAFNGSALRFSDRDRALFDPTSPHRANKHPTQKIGLIVSGVQDRWCRKCVAEAPGFRRLSWRLQTQLICVEHAEVLAMNEQPTAPLLLTPEIVEMQSHILSRLKPSLDNAAFFVDLEGQLRRANSRGWEPLHLRAAQDPERALAELACAVRMALSRGYPDAQGLTGWPVQARTRHIRAPRSLGFTDALDIFPHLLPTRLFVGRFSDLLFPAMVRDGRSVAALGTLMSATGCDLYTAIELLPPRRRIRNLSKFFQQLVRLEHEGRAELFWRECRRAGTAVIADGVGYRVREGVCSAPVSVHAAITAEPAAHEGMVRTWLVDQWACTYTSSRVRPSVLDRSIEDFDRGYGPGMRSALEQVVQERAA